MSISHQETSSFVSSTASVSITLPTTGLASGDLFVASIGFKYPGIAAPATVSGWTLVGQTEAGVGGWAGDSGLVNIATYIRESDGTETGTVNFFPAGVVNAAWGSVSRFRKTSGTWNYQYLYGKDVSLGASWSASSNVSGYFETDGLCVVQAGVNGNLVTIAANTLTASGVTFGTLSTHRNNATSAGYDGQTLVVSAPISSGDVWAAPTFTATHAGASGNTPAGPVSWLILTETAAPDDGILEPQPYSKKIAWTRQPPVGVPISSPLWKAIAPQYFGFSPTSGTVTLASGATYVPGPQGEYAVKFVSGSSSASQATITIPSLAPSVAKTFIVRYFDPGDSLSGSTRGLARLGATRQYLWCIQPDGRISVALGSESAGAPSIVLGNRITGKWVTLVVSFDGTISTAVCSEYLSNVQTSATSLGATAATTLYAGDGITTYDLPNGLISFCAVIPKAFSTAELLEIVKNPWQLFAPVSRTFIMGADAGGGGGDVSVSLSGAGLSVIGGTLLSSLLLSLSGSSSTFSSGTTTNTVSYALSSNLTTTALGSLKSSLATSLSGQNLSFSTGTLKSAVSTTLTGQGLTTSTGTVVGSTTSDVVVSLAGQGITLSTGTIVSNISTALSGQAITFSQGTMSPISGVYVTLKAGSWIRYRTI